MTQKEPKKRVGIQVFQETMERLRRLRAEIEIETGKRLSMDGVIQRLVENGEVVLKIKEVKIEKGCKIKD
ncbi:MAG: hypothetical protein J6U20_03905 [Fibrobacter sp.]|nr:hypothetical protein [Fibrobacter sp.]